VQIQNNLEKYIPSRFGALPIEAMNMEAKINLKKRGLSTTQLSQNPLNSNSIF